MAAPPNQLLPAPLEGSTACSRSPTPPSSSRGPASVPHTVLALPRPGDPCLLLQASGPGKAMGLGSPRTGSSKSSSPPAPHLGQGSRAALGTGPSPFGKLRIKRVRSSEDEELALDNFMSSKRYLSSLMASGMTNLRLADVRASDANNAGSSPAPGTPNGSTGSLEFRSCSPHRGDAWSLGHRSPSPSPFANDESPRSVKSDDSADSCAAPHHPSADFGFPVPRGGVGRAYKGASCLQQCQPELSSAGRPPLAGQTLFRADQGSSSLSLEPAGVCWDRRSLRHTSASCSHLPQVRGMVGGGAGAPEVLCRGGEAEGTGGVFEDRSEPGDSLAGPLSRVTQIQRHAHLWAPQQLPSPRSLSPGSPNIRRTNSDLPLPPPPINVPRPGSSLLAMDGSASGYTVELPSSPSDRTSSDNLRKTALMRAQQKRSQYTMEH